MKTYSKSEERPHALRALNPSFSTIVDHWSRPSITIVNRGSLPQIVLFNDHGSFKPINDHDRKLKKRRSRIVVFANDRRSSLSPTTADRFRRRSQIVSPTTVVIARQGGYEIDFSDFCFVLEQKVYLRNGHVLFELYFHSFRDFYSFWSWKTT